MTLAALESTINAAFDAREGISTTFVSSRPSISTFVVTNRLAIGTIPICRGEHRTHDLWVCAATTEVATHSAPHVCFGRLRVFLEQRDAGENLPWSAESALQRVMVDERLLERVQLVSAPDPLDSRDLPILARRRKRETRIHRSPVEQNGAGPAFPSTAHELRSGQLQPLAQRHEKRLMSRGGDLVRGSVDDETHASILARTTSNRRISRGTHALRHY